MISVRAVIELGVEAIVPPLTTRGGQLALDIQKQAGARGYPKTPDGWFVPISDLLSRIEDVADFLHLEALHYGEFNIYGGFEIMISGYSVGLPESAFFGGARELANTIINLREEGKMYTIVTSGSHQWTVSLEDKNEVRIQVGRIGQAPFMELHLPTEELKEQFELALSQLDHFVTQITPLLLNYQDIPLQVIRVGFGLE